MHASPYVPHLLHPSNFFWQDVHLTGDNVAALSGSAVILGEFTLMPGMLMLVSRLSCTNLSSPLHLVHIKFADWPRRAVSSAMPVLHLTYEQVEQPGNR